MKINKKILRKKIKELSVKEFLEISGEKGSFYKDITEECEFEPCCKGGSNNAIYGVDENYFTLGIYYKKELIFEMNVNSFKEESFIQHKYFFNENEDIYFHWLDKGYFMIVKKVKMY